MKVLSLVCLVLVLALPACTSVTPPVTDAEVIKVATDAAEAASGNITPVEAVNLAGDAVVIGEQINSAVQGAQSSGK